VGLCSAEGLSYEKKMREVITERGSTGVLGKAKAIFRIYVLIDENSGNLAECMFGWCLAECMQTGYGHPPQSNS